MCLRLVKTIYMRWLAVGITALAPLATTHLAKGPAPIGDQSESVSWADAHGAAAIPLVERPRAQSSGDHAQRPDGHTQPALRDYCAPAETAAARITVALRTFIAAPLPTPAFLCVLLI
mgnify:CR=1 FL=1